MIKINLFNSYTGKLQPLITQRKNNIRMYVCGPTVYDRIHIGNLRPVVVFDVLHRFFLHVGYRVFFVSNYTDIDDKIIDKAIKEKKSEREIAHWAIDLYEQDVTNINSLFPTHQPRVTDFIEDIVQYIQHLIDVNAAYVVDGEVFFRVKKSPRYGELSKIKINDLLIGARVEENLKKESPLDFTIWKKSDKGITFDSPWGQGRPGWHTECVALVDSIFQGQMIDIHGGGSDLKFPHHENEIAQSQAVNGHELASIWMHNGLINIDQEKMSKSVGNILLASEAINRYGGATLRLMMLATHYRAPLNITEQIIANADNDVKKIDYALRQTSLLLQLNGVDTEKTVNGNIDNFLNALADDLNTPNALTEIYNVIKQINGELRGNNNDKPSSHLVMLFFTLKKMLNILGIDIKYPILNSDDVNLYQRYRQAKENKEFHLSDELRAKLIERKIL
jgi:cysteinyl-tRNA synthetase